MGVEGWAGEGDKHLGHNHRRHHQHQYLRHVVAPAKSLDARKHAPPAVSSISSSVSGSLRSRSPPRRVLLPSPFRPRSSFLFISRHHLLSLAFSPLPPLPSWSTGSSLRPLRPRLVTLRLVPPSTFSSADSPSPLLRSLPPPRRSPCHVVSSLSPLSHLVLLALSPILVSRFGRGLGRCAG